MTPPPREMPIVRATFVKVGGSVITVKNAQEPTPKVDAIKAFAEDIAELYSQGVSLILANGAGSFGHPLAERAELHRGLLPDRELQAAETAHSALTINFMLVDELIGAGVPAISFSPRSYVYGAEEGWVAEITPIRMALERGLVPVTFGDVVMHLERGAAIFSADDAPSVLSPLIEEAIFLVDVPGVLGPDGKVVREVTPSTMGLVGESAAVDVTGGMGGKLRKGFELVEKGIPVRIAGFFSRGDLLRAFRGESGTALKL